MRLKPSNEAPFLIVVVLALGEFSWAIWLAVKEAHIFALYLAIKYTLSEEWSPFHYVKEHVKRKCWKHIPFNQCIPNEVK